MPTLSELFKNETLFGLPENEILLRIDDNIFTDNHQEKPHYFYYFPLILIKYIDNQQIKEKVVNAFENFISKASQVLTAKEHERILFFKNLGHILLYKEKDTFNGYVLCIEYIKENILFFEEIGIDREDLINKLTWESRENIKLHPFLEKNKKKNQLGYKIIIYLIRNWFLPKYDFDSVKKIIRVIAGKSARKNKLLDIIKRFGKTSNVVLSIIPTLIIGIYLWSDKIKAGLFDLEGFPTTFDAGEYTVGLKGKYHIINTVFNTPEIFFEFLFIILILWFLWKLRSNTLQKYLITPRLLIGIFLGYLASISSMVYWSLGILSFSNGNFWAIIITNILLLVVIFFYIRYEVRKSIGDTESEGNEIDGPEKISNKDKINIRSLEFFRKAVWSSFFIGLVILDLFFIVYLRNIESELGAGGFTELSNRFHTGIIGIIDPVMLLFFFPLALITGVVIKFILDEKPITNPIK